MDWLITAPCVIAVELLFKVALKVWFTFVMANRDIGFRRLLDAARRRQRTGGNVMPSTSARQEAREDDGSPGTRRSSIMGLGELPCVLEDRVVEGRNAWGPRVVETGAKAYDGAAVKYRLNESK